MNFVACSDSEDGVLDKEDLSTYHKTNMKVNGMQYLIRLEHNFYTPDMWANICSPSWGAAFGVNGVREDGFTVSLEGQEIPTPLKSNSNIGNIQSFGVAFGMMLVPILNIVVDMLLYKIMVIV